MRKSHIATIILAAGTSSRFSDGNKLLQLLDGNSVIEKVVSIALAGRTSQVVVVTGFDNERIEEALSGLNVRIVFNSEFAKGMGTSIAAGVRAVPDANGYAIWPADMPFVSNKSVDAVFKQVHIDRIVVPVFEGRRGHPVVFGSNFRSEMMKLDRDVGAREIHHRHPEAVIEVPVDDQGIHLDIDTVEEVGTVPSEGVHRSSRSPGARR